VETVTLFRLHTDQVKVTIEARIDEAGNLVVEGYDIGKTVEEFWGDSDYEYSVTVPAAETEKMFAIIGVPRGDNLALLSWLQNHFHTNTCYSDFRNWLDKHQIRSEGFSWR